LPTGRKKKNDNQERAIGTYSYSPGDMAVMYTYCKSSIRVLFAESEIRVDI